MHWVQSSALKKEKEKERNRDILERTAEQSPNPGKPYLKDIGN
jgi:hypothetical protein